MKQATEAHNSLSQYIFGYVLSMLFTFDAYLIVSRHLYQRNHAMIYVAVLAVLQLIVQLVFFLHLGRGPKAQTKLIVFGLMLFYVLLVVIGSLWIMQHLNYNMNQHQVNKYLNSQDGL